MDNKELLKKLDRDKGLVRNYDETVFIGDISSLTAGRTPEQNELIPDEIIQATNDLKNKTDIEEPINTGKTLEETKIVAPAKKASTGLKLEVLNDQAINEKGAKSHTTHTHPTVQEANNNDNKNIVRSTNENEKDER